MQGLLLFVLFAWASSDVLISEIMYNPRLYDEWFQYLELYNNGTAAVTLTGWKIKAVNFSFPPGSSIAPGQYKVIGNAPDKLLWAYPSLTPTQILGTFGDGELALNGEKVELENAAGVVVFLVDYGTNDPWPLLANGFGPSLELMCYDTDDFDKAKMWTASTIPIKVDKHEEYGGTPGQPPRWKACLYQKYTVPNVLISEVMYAPYKQIWYGEMEEFVEIKNNASVPIDISSWKIVCDDGMRYVFPAATTLSAGEFVTVVRNQSAFLAVYNGVAGRPTYTGRLFAGWDGGGDLPNSASWLAIVDNNERVVDALKYDIKGDFPMAADSLGADNDTLPADSPFLATFNNPVGGGTYRDIATKYFLNGQSLTRRSWQWNTNHGYNWWAQDPNPGRDRPDTSLPLTPVIESIDQKPKKSNIIGGIPVNITMNVKPLKNGDLSSIPPLSSVQMTWWTWNPITEVSGTRTTVPMTFNGDDGFYAVIPAQPAGTLVQYSMVINYADGRSTTEPLLADPYRFHSVFFDPEPDGTWGKTEIFHLFINPTKWQRLIDNANSGRTNGCAVNPRWQEHQPATLIWKGDVFYGSVRLQGSRYNRMNGQDVNPIAAWPGVRPSGGSLKAYSYRFDLPAQEEIKNNRAVLFQKMLQGGTMYQTPLINKIFDKLGVPAPEYEFVRLRINGAFFRYYMLVQHGGADWIKRSRKITNQRCIHQATEQIGDVWKVRGFNPGEGPYCMGDFRSLVTNPVGCTQYNANGGALNYEWTYSRMTYGAQDQKQISSFIEQMQAATTAQRKVLMNDRLDMNAYLNYFVVDAFAAVWDHTIHNQFILRRLEDSRFSWLPWDADMMFGERQGWDLTTGGPFADGGHQLKQMLVASFTPEIQQRTRLLLNTVLSTASLQAMMAETMLEFNTTHAAMSNAWCPFSQNFNDLQTQLDRWFRLRRNNAGFAALNTYTGDPTGEFATISCPQKPNVTKLYNIFTSRPGPSLPPIVNLVDDTVYFYWTPGNPQGAPITSYNLQMQINGSGPFFPVRSVTPQADGTGNTTMPIDFFTPYGSNYTFRVQAVNALGNSEWSDGTEYRSKLDCLWQAWTGWTNCTRTCANGTQTRTRVTNGGPLNGGFSCPGFPGNASENQGCNMFPCPIDCTWNQWTNWSTCSLTCGTGLQYRNRTSNPELFGGAACVGNPSETQNCNTQNCPIDCTWNEWTNWTACTVSCANGTQYRNRTSNLEQFGGAACVGMPDETQGCNMFPCPIDCTWNEWGNWSTCSVTCGDGDLTRVRTQNAELFGGLPCDGNGTETTPCQTGIPCNTDCTWNEWGNWSACTKTCETGTQTRIRDNVPAVGTGAPCTGPNSEDQNCNTDPCAIDCTLNEWSQWGPCCGNNTVFRNRTENMAQWGGLPCEGPWDEERECEDDLSGCHVSNGLPTGAMVGIIIGAILGFLLLLALIALALYQASANTGAFETI